MRVLESKTSQAYSMGKRKHKLRKQNKDNEQCPSDSSDEGALAAATGMKICPHIIKSINVGTVKKSLKQLGSLGECTTCQRDQSQKRRPEDTNLLAAVAGGDPDDSLMDTLDTTIWVCLQCGHQGCDRNSQHKHALKHYQTPRSASHAIVVNINTWLVWCYDCDDEVPAESSKRVLECVEFLRKQSGLGKVEPRPGTPNHTTGGSGGEVAEGTNSDEKGNHLAKPKAAAQASVSLPLPKVKGLCNLGNTCFFNAVMQNVSQTLDLEVILAEHTKKGAAVVLPGQQVDSDCEEGSSSSSEEDKDDDSKLMEMEPVTVQLTENGSLTPSLLSFLRDMNSTSKNSTISPGGLFGQVCKKAPRFKGFQQQDSHELLRHLLDGMKAEEIKRIQTGILKFFHLPESVNPKKVSEETKQKIKVYGRQAKYTFVDSLFGGVLISAVFCEECHTPSQIFEPFLDLSLPITEEKTPRPNSPWTSKRREPVPAARSPETDDASYTQGRSNTKSGPSKHQTKKAKKQAKKDAKRKQKQKSTQPAVAANGENKGEGEEEKEDEEKDEEEEEEEEGVQDENGDGSSSSKAAEGKERMEESGSNGDEDISDADIEDNLESDASKHKYCSKKPKQQEEVAANGVENHKDDFRTNGNGSVEQTTIATTTATAAAGVVNGDIAHSGNNSKTKEENTQLCNGQVDKLANGLEAMDINDDTQTPGNEDRKNWEEGPCAKENGCGKDEASPNCAREESAPESSPKCVKRKLDIRSEAVLKAMASLAPRHQSVAHECSVMSCLNQFTAAELLTGNNKFGCRACTRRKYEGQASGGKRETVYTNASKQLLIFSPPAVLTLHLKRFQQFGYTLRKVNRHVDFPLILDLAPFCSSLCQGIKPSQSKVLYSLYGVVEHSGRLTGGHYTAYVKVRHNNGRFSQFLRSTDHNQIKLKKILRAMANQEKPEQGEVNGGEPTTNNDNQTAPPGRWFYISDSRVNEVTEASVLRCQAYILFYERIY